MYGDGAGCNGAAKYIRPTNVVYPNGRDVQYGYGTTGAIDDIMSRLETISDTSGTLAGYKYLGLGTIVKENFPRPASSSITIRAAMVPSPASTASGGSRTSFGKSITSTATATKWSMEPWTNTLIQYDRAGNVDEQGQRTWTPP